MTDDFYCSHSCLLNHIFYSPLGQVEFWRITSGILDCEIVDDGRCITDGFGNYQNNAHCEVEVLRILKLTTEQYDVEEDYDFVTVKGVKYTTAYSGPNQVTMQSGEKWTW